MLFLTVQWLVYHSLVDWERQVYFAPKRRWITKPRSTNPQHVYPSLINYLTYTKTHPGGELTDSLSQVKPIPENCAHAASFNRCSLSSSDSPIRIDSDGEISKRQWQHFPRSKQCSCRHTLHHHSLKHGENVKMWQSITNHLSVQIQIQTCSSAEMITINIIIVNNNHCERKWVIMNQLKL